MLQVSGVYIDHAYMCTQKRRPHLKNNTLSHSSSNKVNFIDYLLIESQQITKKCKREAMSS